ncbi:hypothetical protein DFQ28_000368 [Apophysomyces sp. BC1034]|nr:hypothetical protein DFQ28_000368 [Apophysomyces sp. BC1034]
MSLEAFHFSFAKYLELIIYSSRFVAPSTLCQHVKSKTAIMRCFRLAGITVKLVFENGKPYELRAPRIQAGPLDVQPPTCSARISATLLKRWRFEIAQDVDTFFKSTSDHLDSLERYVKAEAMRQCRENHSLSEPAIHDVQLDAMRKGLEADHANLLQELGQPNEYDLNDFRRLFAIKSLMILDRMRAWQQQRYAELSDECTWDAPDYIQSKHIHCFPDSPILVREDEPTSIIAYTLSSSEYIEEMKHDHQFFVQGHEDIFSHSPGKDTLLPSSADTTKADNKPHILDGYYSSIERKYVAPSAGGGTETASFRTMVIETVKASVSEAHHHHAQRLSGLFKNRWHQNAPWYNEAKIDNRKVRRQHSERLLETEPMFKKEKAPPNQHLTKEIKISSYYCDAATANSKSNDQLTAQQISPHIKHRFVHDQTEFTCTVYYAQEFEAIRRQCGIDQLVIQSLSRCHVWTACGGKSKSHFYKTRDDRFVVKEMVNAWNIAEKDAFLKFAPKYFDYLKRSVEKPTVLAKIFGFYSIRMKSTNDKSVDLEMDVLVMEHLFHGQTITRRFDLKGIQDRHVDECRKQQSDATLWDGDWVDEYRMRLLVDEQSHALIEEAIQNDTDFLSQSNIMDYSLLVGVDDNKKEMSVGIKIENKGKTTFLQPKKEVTVVPPDQYKERFCREMDDYFIAVPDEQSSLNFEKDEYIDVLNQLDSGWWDGWCNGMRGWFPSNYVEIVSVNPAMADSLKNNKIKDGKRYHTETIENTKRTPVEPKSPLLESPRFRPHSLTPPAATSLGWSSSSRSRSNSSNTSSESSSFHTPAVGWTKTRSPYDFQPGEDDGSEIGEYDSESAVGHGNRPLRTNGSIYSGDDDHILNSPHHRRLSIDSLPASVEGNSAEDPNLVMSQWVERTTPQGRIYYCNLTTQETTWDYNEIDQITGRLRNNKQEEEIRRSTQMYADKNEPPSIMEVESLTWQKLSTDIATAVYQLNTAAQRGQHDKCGDSIPFVVDSIRLMLYSSRSMDKEAIHMQDRELRDPHRAVMASLSKLVLSVKMATECGESAPASSPSDTLYKVQRDAADLLTAVRNFVTICQNKQVDVESVCPRLMGWNLNNNNGNMIISDKRASLDQTTVVHKAKYPLNQDLIVSLQTHANQIYGSTEALSSATTFILSMQENTNERKARSNVVILFRNLSMQIGQYLSILGDIDLTNVDNSQIPSLSDYRVNKQQLFNAIGSLFGAVQGFTDMDMDTSNSVTDIEDALHLVEDTIENILTSVDQMVGQRRIWLMRGGATVDEDRFGDGGPLTPETPYSSEESKWDGGNITDGGTGTDVDQPTAISRGHHRHRPSISRAEKPRKRQLSNKTLDNRADGSWYLGYDCKDGDIVFSVDGSVKGGTLPALVERLTLHDTLDMSFIANFLLTYRSFCTTEEFVGLLEQRYNLRAPEGLTPDELETWTERKQKLVRLRVFNVMKNWLENYYNDEDEPILTRLEFFTNTVIRDASPFSADQLNRLIRKRKELDANGGLKKLVPAAMTGPNPIMPKNMSRIRLLETDALELARQLSILDFKLYSSIRPIECLGKAWSREDAQGNIATNVKQSIDYCNRLTAWVTGSILVYNEAKKRVGLIKYWAQVANRCRMLNNYNTCMAIISAFDNSAVGRLKKTWELVGSRTNQILSGIRKLMGSNRNFTEYREMIHSVNPPCIPFLGIYLQDLTFIEDGNPDYLKKSNNLINFAKQQKAAESIREIKQFQSPPYTFQIVPELQEFIKCHLENSHDVETLYERSLELEPRETSTY